MHRTPSTDPVHVLRHTVVMANTSRPSYEEEQLQQLKAENERSASLGDAIEEYFLTHSVRPLSAWRDKHVGSLYIGSDTLYYRLRFAPDEVKCPFLLEVYEELHRRFVVLHSRDADKYHLRPLRSLEQLHASAEEKRLMMAATEAERIKEATMQVLKR